MRIIARSRLREFWEVHPQAHAPLEAWYTLVKSATWRTPADVRAMFGSADFVANNRVIFNIGGNNYRLIVKVQYRDQAVYIRFIGTHAEYDDLEDASQT